MLPYDNRQRQVETALREIARPAEVSIRAWTEADFPAIQRLSETEGWLTLLVRSDETLAAWRHSWPTLVATAEGSVIGFVRALTDGEVTTYIAELLVDPTWRGRGIGRALLDVCHVLHPHTRIDLLSTAVADSFYEAHGFQLFRGFRKSYR